MNRKVVGQASRLPLGRLAPASIAGETPAQAAGTAAPLPSGRFMVPMHAKKRKEPVHEPNGLSKRRRRGIFVGRAMQKMNSSVGATFPQTMPLLPSFVLS